MSREQTLRAFRPSRLVSREQLDENSQVDKEAKMAQYEMRAQAGLPLFDTSGALHLDMPKKRR